jgi:glyoxylase-like metal-dependent hydrolase (beta-lactamase superfamily II)/rhodanese-related sulfurtransferase
VNVPRDLVIPLVDEGLGNSSYLVDLGEGRALAIDPSRDLRRLDRFAAQRGLSVTAVAETHLHADFVSGSTRLAARDGAMVLAAAAGNREFPHIRLVDGDEVDLGGLALRAWTTPGHTAEHLAYLLVDGDRVRAAFTGGSLLVGAAARTDLTGSEHTNRLARAQFRSLRRLTQLPEVTPVYPTHGAGSFCSAPSGADRVTTIGREKATNPLLGIADEDRFVDTLLTGLGTFPPYFLRLAEVNRRGPDLPGTGTLRPLTASAVLALRRTGAEIIDVRPVTEYAAAHIPGSLAIALRPAFATWLGWLVPNPQAPLIIVRAPDQDPDEILWQARKIGYDNLVGELDGGITAWQNANQPLASTTLLSPDETDRYGVLDVRQAAEHATAHIPHAYHLELGTLATADLPPGPLATMCSHGERAATGASLLERAGRAVGLLLGGPQDWADATGRRLEARG